MSYLEYDTVMLALERLQSQTPLYMLHVTISPFLYKQNKIVPTVPIWTAKNTKHARARGSFNNVRKKNEKIYSEIDEKISFDN